MAEVNVAVLGLERLGTSFGLALKRYMTRKDARHAFTITGHDRRGYNSKKAKEMGALDATARSAAAAVKDAHIVLITAPYDQVEALYGEIGEALGPGAVVLDTSPLKRPSIGWAAETLPQDPDVAAYLVGITPVLNPEVLLDSGIEVEDAREDLFDKGTFLICPAASCPPEAVELAAEFARIVGASVHFMDVDEHDGLMAAMEGLPAVMGIGLFRALSLAEAWGDLRRLANPTFGLMTHHLRSYPPAALWAMLHYNRQNTARYLTILIETLEALRDSLESDEEGVGLEAALEQAASRYAEWEKQRFTNQWESKDEDIPTASFAATMGGMLFGRRFAERKKGDDEDGE